MTKSENLTIVSVTHDLQKKISIAHIVWDDVADKRLGLPVPFDTALDDLLPAVRAALTDLQNELKNARVKVASA